MSYSPVYRGIWKHEDLDGASFEEKAFFVFLWSNDFIRPSGIYRASDEELSACSELPIDRVRSYLVDLEKRLRIIRDGRWLFVRGYLARQPKQNNLLLGVKKDIASCSSVIVLNSFSHKYQMYSQWSIDRLSTIEQLSINGPPMVGHPMNETRPAVAVAVAEKTNLARATKNARAPLTDFRPTPVLVEGDRTVHPIRYVLTRHDLAFKAKVGVRHPEFTGQDAKLAEGLLKIYGVDRVSEMVDAFFELTDPWVQENGYTFTIFHAKRGKLIVRTSQSSSEDEDADAD